MSLKDNKYTDKGSTHSYIELYDKLLKPIKETAKNVLEVGIGDFPDYGHCGGGSLMMWSKFFTKATVYGVDKLGPDHVFPWVRKDKSVKLYCNTDAYSKDFVSKELKDMKFDMLLDDGPHSFETQIKFIKLYSPLLSENGILMIEDIENCDYLKKFKDATPPHLRKYIKSYDLTHVKGRHDDVVFTIDRIPR